MQRMFKALAYNGGKRDRQADIRPRLGALPPNGDLKITSTSKAANPRIMHAQRRAMLEEQDDNHRFTNSASSSIIYQRLDSASSRS